jgi:mannose-6-phosphate isomerase-like protein (cupin superfamily)
VQSIEINKITSVTGGEGTEVRQIFHPHNTLLGIRYSIIHCRLDSGKSSRPHMLRSSEVYYILNGHGMIHVGVESCEVGKDQAIYVPPLVRQYIKNIGSTPLEFLCIVDPAWRKEDEVIE